METVVKHVAAPNPYHYQNAGAQNTVGNCHKRLLTAATANQGSIVVSDLRRRIALVVSLFGFCHGNSATLSADQSLFTRHELSSISYERGITAKKWHKVLWVLLN
jgi:hypothetical protein